MLKIAHSCCKHSFNKTHVLVASNNIYFSCLEGRIYIKSIASTHYFMKSITSSRCVEDTPRYTLVHTLIRGKYSPVCWVSRKLRPKSKIIPCYTADCFKPSCLQFVDTNQYILRERVWFCNVTSELSHNRYCANRMAFKSFSVINLVYSYKANQTRFECSLLFL